MLGENGTLTGTPCMFLVFIDALDMCLHTFTLSFMQLVSEAMANFKTKILNYSQTDKYMAMPVTTSKR